MAVVAVVKGGAGFGGAHEGQHRGDLGRLENRGLRGLHQGQEMMEPRCKGGRQLDFGQGALACEARPGPEQQRQQPNGRPQFP
ncbi:MAG: hypothetical protein U5J82_09295 [Desulfobacterales bacterium]|nr:hypothetical protein [Desulfobacterales bacterium]